MSKKMTSLSRSLFPDSENDLMHIVDVSEPDPAQRNKIISLNQIFHSNKKPSVKMISNGYYTIPHSSVFGNLEPGFTISMKLKLISHSGVFHKRDSSTTKSISMRFISNRLYFLITTPTGSLGRSTSDFTVQDLESLGVFTLTITYNGEATAGSIKIYINSKRVDVNDYTSGTFTNSFSNEEPLVIGSGPFGSQLFGELYSFRFYNRAIESLADLNNDGDIYLTENIISNHNLLYTDSILTDWSMTNEDHIHEDTKGVRIDVDDSTATYINQSLAVNVGDLYEVSLEVSEVTSGSISVRDNNLIDLISSIDSPGEYTIIVNSANYDLSTIYIRREVADTNIVIRSISVRQIIQKIADFELSINGCYSKLNNLVGTATSNFSLQNTDNTYSDYAELLTSKELVNSCNKGYRIKEILLDVKTGAGTSKFVQIGSAVGTADVVSSVELTENKLYDLAIVKTLLSRSADSSLFITATNFSGLEANIHIKYERV